MSVLPSKPLLKVTSSCALPFGGLVNLLHTPTPHFFFSLMKLRGTRFPLAMLRLHILLLSPDVISIFDLAVFVVLVVCLLDDASRLSGKSPRCDVPDARPTKEEDGTKAEALTVSPHRTIAAMSIVLPATAGGDGRGGGVAVAVIALSLFWPEEQQQSDGMIDDDDRRLYFCFQVNRFQW